MSLSSQTLPPEAQALKLSNERHHLGANHSNAWETWDLILSLPLGRQEGSLHWFWNQFLPLKMEVQLDDS